MGPLLTYNWDVVIIFIVVIDIVINYYDHPQHEQHHKFQHLFILILL